MSKQPLTKSKPKPVKPVLAWCALNSASGTLCPSWVSSVQDFAVPSHCRTIRVEIRPAPRRAEQLEWVERALAAVSWSSSNDLANLREILMEHVRPAPKRKSKRTEP